MSAIAQGKIPPGTVLLDSNKKKWIVGSFIEIDGSAAECYTAAECNREMLLQHYPVLIKVKSPGDKILTSEINFFKQHANPIEIDKWIALKDVHYECLGLPCYLGSAQNVTIADTNLDFLVLTQYGSNLETVLATHNNLFPKPTVLKIAYHILGILEYLHKRGIVHGNIRSCNIRMDLYDKHVYLLPQFHLAGDYDHNFMMFSSEYQHCTATTKRGDLESLLYNIIDWSGGILPWKEASPEEIKDMKNKAFEDPEQFLKDAFPNCDCENPSECLAARKCVASGEPVAASECLQAIRDLMKQVASMGKTYDCTPDYKTIGKILKKRLLNMYHVPTSKLEFAVPTLIGDEDHDGKSSRGERKKVALYVPGLAIAANTLATIIAENCSNFNEVHTLDSKSCGVIDVILQMNVTKRENVIWPAIRAAWEQDTQCLRTMVVELWRSKGLQPGSYRIWKRTKSREKEIKRTATGASMRDEKKAAVRNRSGRIASNNMNVVTTESRHLLELKRQQNQQQKRCNESSMSRSSNNNSRPIKRLKFCNSVYEKDASSTSASESDEDDREDAHPASASKSDDVQTPISSASSNRRSIEYDIDPDNFSLSRIFKQHLDKEPRVVTQKLVLESNEAADESAELFSEETAPETTEVADRTDEPFLEQTVAEMTKEADGTDESFSKEAVPEMTEVADKTSKQAIESLTSVSVNRHSWFSTYQWLDGWLGLREILLKVLEPISSESHLIGSQVQHLRVLRDEYGMQELVDQLGHLTNVLTGLSPDSDDAKKLNQIQQRWLKQLAWLEERVPKLDDEYLNHLHVVQQNSEILAWLIKELDDMPEKLIISTDRETLRQQRERYQTVYQRIINREAQIKIMLDEGRSVLARSQNLKSGPGQLLFLDMMESQWNYLKKNSINCHKKLENCMEHSQKYYQAQKLLSCWLSEVMHKFECLKVSSLNDIEKVLQELSSLSNAVHEKSGDIEQCINLGRTFIGACDEDKDNVLENELLAIKDRWNELSNSLLKRRETFKDMSKNFVVLSKSLLELKDKIQLCDNELASYYALGGAAKEPKLHDDIMELQMEIVSTREQVTDMVHKAGQQGIDANYLMNQVNHVAASIESLKSKAVDTCKKILEEQLPRTVQVLQKMNGDECDNTIRLQDQISKLKVLLFSVESVLSFVTDAAVSM